MADTISLTPPVYAGKLTRLLNVVRLRTSNALKRISREKPAWLVPLVDGFLTEIAELDQASAQWTLADLFQILTSRMTPAQRQQAEAVLKRNLGPPSRLDRPQPDDEDARRVGQAGRGPESVAHSPPGTIEWRRP